MLIYIHPGAKFMENTVITSISDSNEELKFYSSRGKDYAPAKISQIKTDSLAEELELESGDQILEVNQNPLRDILDFNYHLEQNEEIELLVKRGNEEFIVEFDKDFGEEFGAEFETPLFNGVKECSNDCPFCFIEQQPFEDTRSSLHLKDDDFRLSYLHGSYITLTNLNKTDRKRIEELRPGPLYISVHATEIDIRNKMLGRKSSIPIMDELKWLASLDIPCHAQIVLCPGINDGKHLLQTLSDLFTLKDSPLLSAAVVPAGLTKYHKGGIKEFTLDDALEALSIYENWLAQGAKEEKQSFAFLSDEFYLMTGTPVPEHYGDFEQLEDGVGTTRLFIDEIKEEMKRLPSAFPTEKKISWINGTLSKNIIEEIATEISSNTAKLELQPVFIDSEFWGNTNITGVLTGQDILNGLKKHGLENLGDAVIIPRIMLKEDSAYAKSTYAQNQKSKDLFLDDMSLEDIEKELKIPFIKAWGAKELIDAISTNL